MTLVPRIFYQRSPLLVAPEILGKILVRKIGSQVLSGRIVEVEAYPAFTDPAAHGFRAQTSRTTALFKEAGHAYICSIHRYHCLNLVTEGIGIPSSVLIRALEPIEGISSMQQSRNKSKLTDLLSGPGKLTQAMQIDRRLSEVDLTDSWSSLQVVDDGFVGGGVTATKRIGISVAKESKFRFSLTGNPYVSQK